MPPNTERRQEPGATARQSSCIRRMPGGCLPDVQALLRCPVCRSELLPDHGNDMGYLF